MQHWLQALKSDCLQRKLDHNQHVMQTSEIPHIIKFPDISNTTRSARKTIPTVRDVRESQPSLALSRDRPSYQS